MNLNQKVIISTLLILLCTIVIIVDTYYENLGYSHYEIGELIGGYIFIIGFAIALVANIVLKVKNYMNNKKN